MGQRLQRLRLLLILPKRIAIDATRHGDLVSGWSGARRDDWPVPLPVA
jgi:hypothetical protein